MTSSTPPALHGLILPSVDLAPEVGPGPPAVSDHAVQRYRERVERIPRWLAMDRIRALAASASWSRRPAPWTRVLVLQDDTVYGIADARPDVCLLVRDEVVVTVLSRRFVAAAAPLDVTISIPVQRTRTCRVRRR